MALLKPLVLALALVSAVAQASEANSSYIDEQPSVGQMAVDVLFLRPLGLVSTVLGGALFVLQLPFDIGQEGGVKAPFETLVATPARFTFDRPLGHVD